MVDATDPAVEPEVTDLDMTGLTTKQAAKEAASPSPEDELDKIKADLAKRDAQAKASQETAEAERIARENAAATRKDLPGQLSASLGEIPRKGVRSTPGLPSETRGTGTHGPVPVPVPRIAAKQDRQAPPPRVSYRIALREITGTVTALLRESGEQWNDQAKQDLVSTAFISAAKSGVILFDFDAEARP